MAAMQMLIVLPFLLTSLLTLAAAEKNTRHHARFEPAILAFEAQDRIQPPPLEAVLFVGSSSIRLWTNAAAAFPRHAVLNRGFGGSHLSDLNAFFDRIVTPYQPQLIVLYEGDNDIASGKSPEQVLADFEEFAGRMQRALPNTRVLFIAIKPSPVRSAYLGSVRKANQLVRDRIARQPGWIFVDVFTPMLKDSGEPREELFGPDGLHLNDAGYALWADVLGPVLDSAQSPER
jgi:lysophospholipase L1-like esterase